MRKLYMNKQLSTVYQDSTRTEIATDTNLGSASKNEEGLDGRGTKA